MYNLMSFLCMYLDMLNRIDVIIFLYELKIFSILHHPLLSCIIQNSSIKGPAQRNYSFLLLESLDLDVVLDCFI